MQAFSSLAKLPEQEEGLFFLSVYHPCRKTSGSGSASKDTAFMHPLFIVSGQSILVTQICIALCLILDVKEFNFFGGVVILHPRRDNHWKHGTG